MARWSSFSTQYLFTATLFSFVILTFISCTKQPGCIDPNASNYTFESEKDDGSCVYDMSFWLATGKYGGVTIFIDDVQRDYLNCYWSASKPNCGVDTLNSSTRKCTSNIPLEIGVHIVRIEAYDGSIFQQAYTLGENCLSIAIRDMD